MGGWVDHPRGPGTGAVTVAAGQEQGQEPPVAAVHSLAGYKRWRKSPAWKLENDALVLKSSPSPTVPSAS